MDHNSPITSVKKLLMDFLKEKQELGHIDIRENYIKVDTDLPLKKPLITISKGKISTNPMFFEDYIGEEFSEEEYQFIETKGRELNLYYDFHIWNSTSPKLGGETEIERIQERLQYIFDFESNAIPGITFFEFREGTSTEDPLEEGLFHARCTLHIKALWKREFRYDVIDEIEPHGEIKE
ncbi:hypothetical protein RBU61_08290 [Tissierella sp. MB52-C2]|uniref:hypothetical protein n=1 Tax=Tissierella sp. MB52-C2 TaxID=3070999 RepID=UPI00280B3311|nr:hypothetical protein [Tissierella sp. MB52-C2]WMM26663.1 hypothetical protein RBU61_08290 [Tissierella sp. MB52-C2]